LIVDYHVHLRDSQERIDHTPEAVERFAEAALANGVEELGFSEHDYYFRQLAELWQTRYERERCTHDLDAYCDAVLEAKRRGLPVKLGLEVDWVGERQPRLVELLEGYPWDFLLGSVHRIEGEAIDMQPGAFEIRPVEEVWHRYVEELCALAESDSVDVLAHPDLPKIFGRRPAGGMLAELHEQAARAVAAAGLAIEISTAGLRKPVGEIYPDLALLEALRRQDVPVTLAADAHFPELVGHRLGEAVALAREAGIDTVTIFDRRRSRQEPLG
jgi:histidinol-phosphatase (PHP family)